MIPLTTTSCQSPTDDEAHWQRALAEAFRQPEALLAAVGLSPTQIDGGIDTDNAFPLRVPRGYVERMQYGNPSDPLLLQVLSRGVETDLQPGFSSDPVGDGPALAAPGLLHKYHGRVLLVTTGACPIHCRYCFRRHYPYGEQRAEGRTWQQAMNYIAADPSIQEVILSGGDPLTLTTARLGEITDALRRIPHIRRLRIHSRMPIVLPERIDRALQAWLTDLPWQTVLVTHCNHPRELDAAVCRALGSLRETGVTLLNQAVLLRHINDNSDTLTALSEALFAAAVMPYYLHLLDRVEGAAHFEVDEATALDLMETLQLRLPGFLVPRLVREVAGQPYKRPVTARPCR
jgi:EF-P beta-lysylation protein EpmB